MYKLQTSPKETIYLLFVSQCKPSCIYVKIYTYCLSLTCLSGFPFEISDITEADVWDGWNHVPRSKCLPPWQPSWDHIAGNVPMLPMPSKSLRNLGFLPRDGKVKETYKKTPAVKEIQTCDFSWVFKVLVWQILV